MARQKSIEYLNVKQASEMIGVRKEYIYMLIRQGKLPAYRLSQRKTLLLKSDLEDYVQSRMI